MRDLAAAFISASRIPRAAQTYRDAARYNDVRNGDQNALRTVTIQLQNEDHTAIVMTWKLFRARPVRVRWGPLNGKGKDVLVEYLELACERLEME